MWQSKGERSAAGCFICFQRGRTGPGAPGDSGWAAAALIQDGTLVAVTLAHDLSSAGYASGLLALREGPLLERAVRGLPALPEVLLVNATGRDHPRRAGLALHLGARLEIPSVGVTDRPLLAVGPSPSDEHGAVSPLRIADELVGYWVPPSAGFAPWRSMLDGAPIPRLPSRSSSPSPESRGRLHRFGKRAAQRGKRVRGGIRQTAPVVRLLD